MQALKFTWKLTHTKVFMVEHNEENNYGMVFHF